MRGFFWKKFRDNVIVDDLCQETFIRSAADKNNLAKKVIFRGKFGVGSSLNFFQIGRSVAPLLKNDQPLEYRFKGAVNLDSSLPFWGTVNLPFERSGLVQIKK